MGVLLMLLLNIGIFAGIFYAFNRFLARSARKDKFLSGKDVSGWERYGETSCEEEDKEGENKYKFSENPYGLGTGDVSLSSWDD